MRRVVVQARLLSSPSTSPSFRGVWCPGRTSHHQTKCCVVDPPGAGPDSVLPGPRDSSPGVRQCASPGPRPACGQASPGPCGTGGVQFNGQSRPRGGIGADQPRYSPRRPAMRGAPSGNELPPTLPPGRPRRGESLMPTGKRGAQPGVSRRGHTDLAACTCRTPRTDQVARASPAQPQGPEVGRVADQGPHRLRPTHMRAPVRRSTTRRPAGHPETDATEVDICPGWLKI